MDFAGLEKLFLLMSNSYSQVLIRCQFALILLNHVVAYFEIL